MMTLITSLLGGLGGPAARVILGVVLLFGAVAWIRNDARREVIAACDVKLRDLDLKWQRQIEATTKEASNRVAAAETQAQAVPAAPAAPDDLVRLCQSEPAGCRAARQP